MYQKCIRHVSKMYRHVSKMYQTMYKKCVISDLWDYIRLFPLVIWDYIGLYLKKKCNTHVSNMYQTCIKHVSGMYQACIRHVSSMYQALYQICIRKCDVLLHPNHVHHIFITFWSRGGVTSARGPGINCLKITNPY